MDIQEPDNLGASLAASKSNDMAPDAFVQKGTLFLVRLKVEWVRESRNLKRRMALTAGRTLAMSWLPVTDRAKSTIIALRALKRDVRQRE